MEARRRSSSVHGTVHSQAARFSAVYIPTFVPRASAAAVASRSFLPATPAALCLACFPRPFNVPTIPPLVRNAGGPSTENLACACPHRGSRLAACRHAGFVKKINQLPPNGRKRRLNIPAGIWCWWEFACPGCEIPPVNICGSATAARQHRADIQPISLKRRENAAAHQRPATSSRRPPKRFIFLVRANSWYADFHHGLSPSSCALSQL